MNIPIAYNKFRSHLFNSSDAAIKLVEKKPSDNNINFALKLLRAKMANAEKTLKRYPELSEDFEYSIKKYCRLSKKIISIKNVRDNQAQGLVENRTGAPTLYEPKQKDYSNKLLVGYDLARKDLRRCNFSDANFSPVDVIYRCSKPVNFSWSNLDGVDLSSAMLEGANFSNCSLAGAKICVNNANFTAAKLDDAVITLDLPSHWNSRRSERLLNDANKNNTIFDTIDSIDDTYADIKVKLMHQVIDSVFDNDHALQGSIPGIALLNSFVSKDIYQQDEKISKTIEALVRSEMLYANSKVSMDECSAKTLSLFLDKFSQSNDDMLKFNGAFIQLMTVCVNHNILSVKKQARVNRHGFNRHLRVI
ncbi:hypothetical protein BV501_06830 [Erwinia sp. OAMSP11]|uniref:pentapeptide repeat-containing protein n=1 Tax=Erwinia sp. OAMSP11 TaxID=1933285 RepID=UPI000C18267E|nr:pentapeptide repeat-containing protein [Erwinia sp. OAMSP11]PIJ50698.1 hypothetical protein BV501_06830 [Erwinia sp. OAMSP11]